MTVDQEVDLHTVLTDQRSNETSTAVSGICGRKRKLFDSSSQVTPVKRSFRNKFVQRSPPIQKYTQVTPKHKESKKSNTVTKIEAEIQTDSCPADVKTSNQFSQTPRTITNQKCIQVSAPTLIANMKSSDKELKKYTGIEDFNLFKIFHKYLVASCSQTECEIDGHDRKPCEMFPRISTENQLLLVLYKLKRNPIDDVLASDFDISTGRVSEIFKFWIQIMYRKFKILKI